MNKTFTGHFCEKLNIQLPSSTEKAHITSVFLAALLTHSVSTGYKNKKKSWKHDHPNKASASHTVIKKSPRKGLQKYKWHEGSEGNNVVCDCSSRTAIIIQSITAKG